MTQIMDIEGIGGTYGQKLVDAGIDKVEQLLEAGSTPQGRSSLAQKTDISESLILRWVNMADLFRVKGVAEEYSDLLEASGVDTVIELAHRDPEHLFKKVMEVNEERKLTRRTPTESQIATWIADAKTLPRMVSY